MSRGLPPGGPWSPHPGPDWLPSAGFGAMALRVLMREVVIGTALWGCRSGVLPFDIATGALCFALVALVTRRFGILRPHGWARACQEAVLLSVGGCCLANILLVMLGLAPWFANGPG